MSTRQHYQHASHSNGGPTDEPPWSPALIEAIQEKGHCYLVADAGDAERMTTYGLLTLPVPAVELLTLDILKPVEFIDVLQRPQDTVFGVEVRRRLVDIRWSGDFNRASLLPVQPDTAAVERDCAGDRERFCTTILGAFDPLLQERLKAPRTERQAKKSRPKGPRPVIVHADQVQAQPIQWLWKPYIPRGMLIMLDGDPGLGKSLMLVQVATNLSTCQPFLDQWGKPTLAADVEGPQTTLILSAEDSLSHVMIPRLQRAGADLTRIKFLTGWLGPEDEERAFDLQHLPVLIQAIQEVKPLLVILDPLVAYLGDIDMHRSNQTRPLMAALTKIGDRYDCTIMGVRHPSKLDQGGPLMYRGQGNMDIIGAARSGLWVQKHPAHPETHTIMIHSKTNVGSLGRTVVFSREKGEFQWIGVSRLTEEMITGKGPDPYAMLHAFYLFEEEMTPGVPYRSDEMEKKAMAEGISTRTIDRVKRLLKIRSVKNGEMWYWILPPL